MLDLLVFNQKQLLESADNDIELAKQIIEIFLSETPNQIQELLLALSLQDVKTLERLAHSIKGSSATIGGEKLADLASRLESYANLGKIDLIRLEVSLLNIEFLSLRDTLQANGY